MNIKEFKTEWENKTLGELKAYINQVQDLLERTQRAINKEAQNIINLDTTNNNYDTRLANIANTIKSYSKDVKDIMKELEILNPILSLKELKEVNQTEYEKYMTDNNDNIKILIKTVEEMKEENRNYFKDEMDLEDEEINKIHADMLKELILILKDTVGDIAEVKELKYNNHKGFDGMITGEKGKVNIQTIRAGGWNKQKLHYRTLVYMN